MKLLIEEKDETQTYRPIPAQQFLEAVKCLSDRVVVYVPNLCGGETRITICKSTIPDGHPGNNLSNMEFREVRC